MRNKTFYPELVIKLNENPQKNTPIILDNGKNAILKFNDVNMDIEEYFNKLAKVKTNDNITNRKLKEIKKNKDIKKELRQEIYKERPDLKGLDPDEDEELYEEFTELFDKKMQEKAIAEAIKESKIQKNSIIKLAGITEIEDNNITINSKSLYLDQKNIPRLSGIYMFAVISRKLPILIKQTRNKKPSIILHKLTNIEQLLMYIKNQLTTLEATTKETIKLRGKNYTLKNVPKPYITLNQNIEFPETLKEAVKIINTKTEDIEKLDIQNLINNLDNDNNHFEYQKEELELNHKNFKYIIAFKYISNYIIKNFNNNVLDNIYIYLPLGMGENNYKEMLSVILKGNKSGKEGRLGIISSLLNTTFANYKGHKLKIEEIITNKFWELYEQNKLEFNTTYTTEINTFVGFFPQNINTKNAVLSSNNYTEIIEEVYNFTKSLKK